MSEPLAPGNKPFVVKIAPKRNLRLLYERHKIMKSSLFFRRRTSAFDFYFPIKIHHIESLQFFQASSHACMSDTAGFTLVPPSGLSS